jgi:probable rRNA maturation factor
MAVTIEVRTKMVGVDPASLAQFAARARKAAGVRGAVGVVLTSNAEMKRMNSWFRGKKEPTDVLSFAAQGIEGYAGDISISVDIARANARRIGHSMTSELQILVLHGMLHLAGYDHEKDDGEMAAKEQQLRAKLALPGSLIERSAKPRMRTARAK